MAKPLGTFNATSGTWTTINAKTNTHAYIYIYIFTLTYIHIHSYVYDVYIYNTYTRGHITALNPQHD